MLVIKELRDCLFSLDRGGANRVTADSHRRYLLPRVTIKKYNIEIDGRNVSDQPINDVIKQYDEVKKVSSRKVMITQLVAYWILLTSKTITE